MPDKSLMVLYSVVRGVDTQAMLFYHKGHAFISQRSGIQFSYTNLYVYEGMLFMYSLEFGCFSASFWSNISGGYILF